MLQRYGGMIIWKDLSTISVELEPSGPIGLPWLSKSNNFSSLLNARIIWECMWFSFRSTRWAVKCMSCNTIQYTDPLYIYISRKMGKCYEKLLYILVCFVPRSNGETSGLELFSLRQERRHGELIWSVQNDEGHEYHKPGWSGFPWRGLANRGLWFKPFIDGNREVSGGERRREGQ